jgi:hypothetical protein
MPFGVAQAGALVDISPRVAIGGQALITGIADIEIEFEGTGGLTVGGELV